MLIYYMLMLMLYNSINTMCCSYEMCKLWISLSHYIIYRNFICICRVSYETMDFKFVVSFFCLLAWDCIWIRIASLMVYRKFSNSEMMQQWKQKIWNEKGKKKIIYSFFSAVHTGSHTQNIYSILVFVSNMSKK